VFANDSVDPDRMRELVLEKLGADRFQTLSSEGRRMSLDQAVAEARAAAG